MLGSACAFHRPGQPPDGPLRHGADIRRLPRPAQIAGETDSKSEPQIPDNGQFVVGPSGTGKTHLATGLGLAACQKGMTVGFLTAAGLVNQLTEARDEKRLIRLQSAPRFTLFIEK